MSFKLPKQQEHKLYKDVREFPSSVCRTADIEVSMYPEGPAIGHLDTSFLVLLCLQANVKMVSEIRSFYCTPPDLY
jgi:hypothetical protein